MSDHSTLNGDAGNDRIEVGSTTIESYVFGGAGNDYLIGGTGTNLFSYEGIESGGFDRDLIENFTQGQDQIDLTRFGDLEFSDLNVAFIDEGTVVDLSAAFGHNNGSDTITVVGVNLTSESFVFA
jgi:Ca2+-binding RTX toxin-like protein